MGSTHNRSVVLKRLKEAIENEKDPDRLTKLTAQYVKLNAQRRTRKSADVPAADSKGKVSLLTRIHHNGLDDLSPQNKLRHFQVLEFEKREKEHRKRTGQKLTEDEKKALFLDVMVFILNQVTEEDRTLLLADDPTSELAIELVKYFNFVDGAEGLKG